MGQIKYGTIENYLKKIAQPNKHQNTLVVNTKHTKNEKGSFVVFAICLTKALNQENI